MGGKSFNRSNDCADGSLKFYRPLELGFTLTSEIATHKQYPIAPFLVLFLCLVEPRLGLHFFRDDSRARDRRICADFL